MAVVLNPSFQTVDNIYALIRQAVTRKQPVSAIYDSLPRLLCPHRLGRNAAGQTRVLCYQYGGSSSTQLASNGSPANWRCMNPEKFRAVQLIDGIWHTAPNHSRPQTCITVLDIDTEDRETESAEQQPR